jgi:ATP-binding cassette subfamily B protein
VEKAKDARGTLWRLCGNLGCQKTALITTTLMVIISTLLNLSGPYLMGVAIDRYIISGDLPGLARRLLWMVAVYVTASLLTFLQT